MNTIKDLTSQETEKLRKLFWALEEARQTLQKEAADIALKHGCDLAKEQWTNSPDWKRLVRIK